MTSAKRDRIARLAGQRSWPSVSLYLPTHRAGSDKEQDPIRFKNLLRTACDGLTASGMREPEAQALCSRVHDLTSDSAFWRDNADGLAVFAGRDALEVVRIDATLPELSVVGERFYLRPLFAADRGERSFFALALDRSGCRLFAGDADGIREVELVGVPASLADELRYDEVQPAVQYSSVPTPASAAGGGRPTGAIFHGHGGEKDVDKVNLERYLRKVEAAVTKACAEAPGTPLVLLGVDYTIAVYRALNTSPALVDAQVSGATDELAAHEIHARALEALEPHFESVVESRLQSLRDKAGTSLVSHSPTEIVAAAASGRVSTLFLDDGTGPFGTFDRDTLTVDSLCADAPRLLREGPPPENTASGAECGWDLVDLAAAETALHGGEVIGFTGEDAPVRGVAALMRY